MNTKTHRFEAIIQVPDIEKMLPKLRELVL